MDKNEIMGVLKNYVETQIQGALYGLPRVKPSYSHIGDERVDGVEYQWWRVSFQSQDVVRTYILRVSYSAFLDAAQVEHFGLQGRKVYADWACDYIRKTEVANA